MTAAENKRLTVSLPADVWERLRDEAATKNVSIGTFARTLIVNRDEKRNK